MDEESKEVRKYTPSDEKKELGVVFYYLRTENSNLTVKVLLL
jgi:hypothetical protein